MQRLPNTNLHSADRDLTHVRGNLLSVASWSDSPTSGVGLSIMGSPFGQVARRAYGKGRDDRRGVDNTVGDETRVAPRGYEGVSLISPISPTLDIGPGSYQESRSSTKTTDRSFRSSPQAGALTIQPQCAQGRTSEKGGGAYDLSKCRSRSGTELIVAKDTGRPGKVHEAGIRKKTSLYLGGLDYLEGSTA